MVDNNILNFIGSRLDHRGIPHIKNAEWKTFIDQYSKDDIKKALAYYITENSVPFPLKEYTVEEFEVAFRRFAETSMLGEYKNFPIVYERADYRHPYSANPLGVIDKSHVFNIVSNYFQQDNRMRCGSNAADSPWTIWHSREKLESMNWHFWRNGALGKSDVCGSTFRSAFRIGTYTATQFKPSVAKALYEKHGAVNILDTSVGWGDRLAGFYATSGTRLYVGCDPNPEVFEIYKKQCQEYEKLLGNEYQIVEEEKYFCCRGSKTVEIYNLPSEDMDWAQYRNTFDFYFTSPPYYETERYAVNHADQQSWNRYPDFTSWKNKFFFKVNRMVWDTLANNAYMMINIIEPRSAKGVRLNLCDDMVDDILTYPDAYYLGKIGMRMQARPHAIVGTEQNSIFVEPIWVFKKGNSDYCSTPLEELFIIT